MIRLTFIKTDGFKITVNAKEATSLEEVCEYAENFVMAGKAEYAKIEVDGKTYCEYEI